MDTLVKAVEKVKIIHFDGFKFLGEFGMGLFTTPG